MKTNKWLLVLCVLALLSVLLTACGGASGASKFPTGKFIKDKSMNYGLEFKADGTFSVFSGGTTLITGTYTADGKTFTETGNTGGCVSPMEFTYTFDGTNLTFNYVGNPEDDASCGGRKADFDNQTYVLSK